MPAFRFTTMGHMVAILHGEKKVFRTAQIPQGKYKLRMIEAFSCKTLMHGGFISEEEVRLYFPCNNPKKVDRPFVWNVF